MTTAFSSLFVPLATLVKVQRRADSMAIRAILGEQVTSWNSGDAPAYSKHFSADGTFTNILGMFFTGHKQFLDRHIDLFQGMFANTVLQQEVTSFRVLRPDVGIVETLTWLSGFSKEGVPEGVYIDLQGRIYTRLLQVFGKERGAWKIIAYHNVDLKTNLPVPVQNGHTLT